MIVYNVTIKVQHEIAAAWLQWLKQEHIAEVIATGCFIQAKAMQLLETDDTEGPTYVIQYFAESKANYNRYIQNHAAAMRQKGLDKWGDRFIAFRSVMQEV
jgi:hypothetical protein